VIYEFLAVTKQIKCHRPRANQRWFMAITSQLIFEGYKKTVQPLSKSNHNSGLFRVIKIITSIYLLTTLTVLRTTNTWICKQYKM